MSYPITKAFKGTIERVTGVQGFIDTDHKYIHMGGAFEVTSIQTGSKKFAFEPRVGAAASTDAYDSDKFIHFRPATIGIAGGELTFQIWEGSSNTSTGTDLVSQNRNRARGASEWKFSVNDGSTTPPASGSYTKIHESKTWGGAGGTGNNKFSAGTETGQPMEWVLKRNTKYVFSVATTSEFAINFFWYEEDDG